MTNLGVLVIVIMCVSGVTLLVAGILLLIRGAAGIGGDPTEASVKDVIKVNVPAQALLVLVGAGLLSGGGYLAVHQTQFNASTSGPNELPPSATASASTASPSPSQSPSAPSEQTEPTLTYPKDGTRVSKSQGFIASGSAANINPSSLWILDSDNGYFVDQQAKIVNGQWTALDAPLGDSSNHLPFDLTMIVVLANPHCSKILHTTNRTSNDYLKQLPGGCKQIGQVTVNVSKP